MNARRCKSKHRKFSLIFDRVNHTRLTNHRDCEGRDLELCFCSTSKGIRYFLKFAEGENALNRRRL